MDPIFNLKASSPLASDVSSMIDALDRYQESLYPAESNHLDSRKTLSESNCKLLGAYLDGKLVGIGAAKMFSDYGELKRFYVEKRFRSLGVAEALIAALEYWLFKNGIYTSNLETGIHQHAAIKFYENHGYTRSRPFGAYREDPLSVFMTKDLSTTETVSRCDSDSTFIVAFSSQLPKKATTSTKVAVEMIRFAKKQDGILALNSVRNGDGRVFTASYWQNQNSASKWCENQNHAKAKKPVQEDFDSSIKLSFAQLNDSSI